MMENKVKCDSCGKEYFISDEFLDQSSVFQCNCMKMNKLDRALIKVRSAEKAILLEVKGYKEVNNPLDRLAWKKQVDYRNNDNSFHAVNIIQQRDIHRIPVEDLRKMLEEGDAFLEHLLNTEIQSYYEKISR